MMPVLPYNFIGRILPGMTLLAIGGLSFDLLKTDEIIKKFSGLSWVTALVLAFLWSAGGYVCALFIS
jgi:hypothetical protein